MTITSFTPSAVTGLLFCGLSLPQLALAADFESSSLIINSSLKMIWGLLVVLALLLIIYGIARKKLSFSQVHSKGVIKILEAKHLLPKKSLFLIEVHGKQYLIGTGTDSIQLITAVDQENEPISFKDMLDTKATGATE